MAPSGKLYSNSQHVRGGESAISAACELRAAVSPGLVGEVLLAGANIGQSEMPCATQEYHADNQHPRMQVPLQVFIAFVRSTIAHSLGATFGPPCVVVKLDARIRLQNARSYRRLTSSLLLSRDAQIYADLTCVLVPERVSIAAVPRSHPAAVNLRAYSGNAFELS